MQSISEYLGVYLGVYVGGLDLTDKWRLSQRWVRIWIIESSAVWGNVWSIVKAGCARSFEMERFHRRGWNLEVFPNNIVIVLYLVPQLVINVTIDLTLNLMLNFVELNSTLLSYSLFFVYSLIPRLHTLFNKPQLSSPLLYSYSLFLDLSTNSNFPFQVQFP